MNKLELLQKSSAKDIFGDIKFPFIYPSNILTNASYNASPQHVAAAQEIRRELDRTNLLTQDTTTIKRGRRGDIIYTQTFKFVSELPLFIYENRCALKYVFNDRYVDDIKIECLGGVEDGDSYYVKDIMYLLNTRKEIEFKTLRDDSVNTLLLDDKLKVYDLTIRYKLPYYAIGLDEKTGNPYDFKTFFEALTHKYHPFVCEDEYMCNYVETLCEPKVHISIKNTVYEDYLKCCDLSHANPAHFVIFDNDKIIDKIKSDFYTWQTEEDGVKKFGGEIRNEDEYYDIMDTVMLSYPYSIYLDLLGIFDSCVNGKMKTFKSKLSHKQHKQHKLHTFEYFIDDVRYEFEGKLDDLIEKLRNEIKDCPKSINTIKKRYDIKKLI